VLIAGAALPGLLPTRHFMPTVAQLRKELKERGLDTKGKKVELEERLEAAGAEEPDEPPPSITSSGRRRSRHATTRRGSAAISADDIGMVVATYCPDDDESAFWLCRVDGVRCVPCAA
jgi:hypothetical protein